MNAIAQLALFAWFIGGVAVVVTLRGRWGVLMSLLIGWMFLPMGEVDLPGLPPVNKATVTSGATLMAVVLLDLPKLLSFKPSVIDIPMLVWCLAPFFSVVTNGPMDNGPETVWGQSGLEFYDAIALTGTHTVTWGVPYLLGRVYFKDARSHQDWLVGIFIAGLLYIPFTWVEMIMSPQWHNWLYGAHAHPDFSQGMRFGGWRPTVFMQHGLMVAFFMTSATVAGYAAWKMKALKKVWGIPAALPLATLGATAVACLSIGAWIQLAIGVGLIGAVKKLRMPMLVAILAIAPPSYLVARLGLGMSADKIEEVVAKVNAERAESVAFRFKNEDWIMEHAMKRPLFGWAGWDREVVHDQNGKAVSVTDGLWTIALGRYGLVGLVSLYCWLLIPPVLALAQLPTTPGSLAPFAGTIAMALVVLQLGIDSIPNAMTGPAYVAAAGGLASLAATRGKLTVGTAVPARRRRPAEDDQAPPPSGDDEGGAA